MPGLGRETAADKANASQDKTKGQNEFCAQDAVQENDHGCGHINRSATDGSDPGQLLTVDIRKRVVGKKIFLENTPGGVHAQHPKETKKFRVQKNKREVRKPPFPFLLHISAR